MKYSFSRYVKIFDNMAKTLGYIKKNIIRCKYNALVFVISKLQFLVAAFTAVQEISQIINRDKMNILRRHIH